MRRLVCLLVALLAGVGGHAIMYSAAVRSMQRFDPDAAIRILPSGAVVLLGAAIAAAAVLTAAWSALGAVLLGVVQILVSLAAVLGSAAGPEGLLFVRRTARTIDGAVDPLGQSLLFSATSGLLLVEGVLTFVIALTLRARRNGWVERPVPARITSAIVSVLFFPPMLLLLLWAGFQQYRVHVLLRTDRLDPPALIGLVVLFLGPFVLAVLALGTRWSGLGAVLAGVAITVGGLVVVAPGLVDLVPLRLPTALNLVAGQQIASGGIAAIGLLLVFGGIGSKMAGLIGDRRESMARADAVESGESPYGIPSFY